METTYSFTNIQPETPTTTVSSYQAPRQFAAEPETTVSAAETTPSAPPIMASPNNTPTYSDDDEAAFAEAETLASAVSTMGIESIETLLAESPEAPEPPTESEQEQDTVVSPEPPQDSVEMVDEEQNADATASDVVPADAAPQSSPERPFMQGDLFAEASVADIFKSRRAERGETLQSVAEKTHVTKTFIQNLENGNFAELPSLDGCKERITLLCKYYAVPVEQILPQFEREYETRFPAHAKSSTLSRIAPCPFDTHSPFLAEQPQLFDSSRRSILSRLLPGVLTLLAIALITALFIAGYIAYTRNRGPRNLDVNLSEIIPMHCPPAVIFDTPTR